MTGKAVCAPLQIGLSRKTSQLKQNKTTKPEKGGGKNQTNIWGSRVFQAKRIVQNPRGGIYLM